MKNAHDIFEKLYRNPKVQERVTNMVAFTLKAYPNEIEEIISQTFIGFFERLLDPKFKFEYTEHGAPTYMANRARNLCIDFFRKQKRSPAIVRDEKAFAHFTHEDPEFEMKVSADELDLIYEQMKLINPKMKEVMELRLAGFSFKKVAEMLDISINTATGRMRYATMAIRKNLDITKQASRKRGFSCNKKNVCYYIINKLLKNESPTKPRQTDLVLQRQKRNGHYS
ncbi:MAG: polymerase subunit sigma-24 [Patescibacteria group bacterium]|nr:polymerase subunit sigma-24 [Patescibacteria group bacterium]